MTDFFGEKSHQVEPEQLNAFGIKVWSRYGQVRELVEMLPFAEELAKQNIHYHIKEIFYNSKESLCHILFSGEKEPDKYTNIYQKVHSIAKQYLTQFIIGEYGEVEKGDNAFDPFEER